MSELLKEQEEKKFGFLKKINLDELPSKGLFYPEDAVIGINPATVKEVRHWSMIDESDNFSFLEAIDYVLTKCCVAYAKSLSFTKEDICEVDRLYLIFAIHEITFPNDENPIFIDIPYTFNGEEYKDSVQITKDNLKYFELPESIINKFYSKAERRIIVPLENKEPLKLRLSSIKASNKVQAIIRQKQAKNKPIDEFFAKVASFLDFDVDTLDAKKYTQMEAESLSWSIKDISLLTNIITKLSNGAKTTFKHVTKVGGQALEVPISFRNGIKSIFIIQDTEFE